MMATLKCRPTEAEKEPIMVFMSSPQMLSLKLKNGDLCTLEHKDASMNAVAWLTSKADLKEGVIGVSKWLQEKTAIKLGNEILVHKATDIVGESSTISLRPTEDIDESQKLAWEFTAAIVIPDTYRYLTPTQYVEFSVGRHRRKFEVKGRDGQIYKAVAITKVNISLHDVATDDEITFDQIGGLIPQKDELSSIINSIVFGQQNKGHHTRTQHATGILLYGPSGTGKTLLRRALTNQFAWSTKLLWKGHGTKPPTDTGRPAIIHIVLRRKLSPQDADALEELFLSLPPHFLVIGEIKDPNDLPESLRSSTAFMHEIEVPIPDAKARHEILNQLQENLFDSTTILSVAQRTHGYTGADLEKLLVQTDLLVASRLATLAVNIDPAVVTEVTSECLSLALTRVRPSALQQVFLEKPNVRWSDIGGQETFKERLRNAVEWPLKYPTQMKEYGIPPKKGVLLFGPPGTGKTMLVKALATESDYNFLAVKGAELISMYVGESERATRDVFKKARAASPCIIFFDEIDAIARRASGSSELNVLTTLLNEMDGFEELKDVLVIAATNKPQSIDPALMRPGRFDNVVYIGPPDAVTRAAIFAEHFRRNTKFSEDCRSRLDSFVDVSDGMSGAEIVAVCQSASEEAFKRSIGSPNNGEISEADMLLALQQQTRTITPAMLEEFENWSTERAAS